MTKDTTAPEGFLPALVIAFIATLLAGTGIFVEHGDRPPKPPSSSAVPVTPGQTAGHSNVVGSSRKSEADQNANENLASADDSAGPAAFSAEMSDLGPKIRRQEVPAARADPAPPPGDYRDWEDDFAATEEAPGGAHEQRVRTLDEMSAFEQEAEPRTRAEQRFFYARSGYWANTHIPGDPAIRLLRTRLNDWDRSKLLGSREPPALEQAVYPVDQPFDAPAGHALALSLLADLQMIESPDSLQVVTLQVGIRAAEHRRGERPAMNLAVVLDIPSDAPNQRWIEARALVDAMMESKGPGDRFALILAHPSHGLVIPPEAFRFGTIQSLRNRLLGEESADKGDPLPLSRALAVAGELLADNEVAGDVAPPMGTRSTLLITASGLPGIESLTSATHKRALDGVHLSAVPLGDRPQPEAIKRLILAGLGHRHTLESPAHARALMDDELYAASRAVARAARLSVNLAPGVELLDIPGSHPLNQHEIRNTRDVEQAMDLKLRQQLGIRSDRGQDDAGIQIVIPTIDSGDEVVVLLKLAVAGPGPLADVSLRYKDLVYLRNSVLQASLPLRGDETATDPASMLVRKNRLSRAFSDSALTASAVLGAGRLQPARQTLVEHLNRLRAARRATPAWAGDSDLLNDEQVLNEYLAVLDRAGNVALGADQIGMLSDSLRFAAWAKTHQPLDQPNRLN